MAEQDPAVGAVDHQADPVVRAELVEQQAQGALHQTEAVLLVHRARDVDDEGEDGGLAVAVVDLARLDGEAQQAGALAGVEGRRGSFGDEREIAAPGAPGRRRSWALTNSSTRIAAGGGSRPRSR